MIHPESSDHLANRLRNDCMEKDTSIRELQYLIGDFWDFLIENDLEEEFKEWSKKHGYKFT